MFRFLVALIAVVCVIECASVDAGGFNNRGSRNGRSQNSYRAQGVQSQYQLSPFGLSIGFGGYSPYGYSGYINPYAYDPYRYGSFKMQDPADDPYLREVYRYDTFFPGRRGARRGSR